MLQMHPRVLVAMLVVVVAAAVVQQQHQGRGWTEDRASEQRKRAHRVTSEGVRGGMVS